jgi:hypothetical protein
LLYELLNSTSWCLNYRYLSIQSNILNIYNLFNIYNLLKDETLRRGGSLDDKTINGPGTFNKGWTPLQMACAYGVEPLVEKLIDAGADVNATNSFGYSPLLDSCHRGFINIVNFLIKGGVDVRYIPSDDDSNGSPFASAPAHCALGEASRCGFQRVVSVIIILKFDFIINYILINYKKVQSLLDGGASKDQCNSLGWTALHEACFYNRIETVKLLLLSGANASARTKQGAMPYHLAGLQILRTMLKDIGFTFIYIYILLNILIFILYLFNEFYILL